MSGTQWRPRRLPSGRSAPVLGTLVLLLCLAGCPVPIPGSVHRGITEETIRRIEPGTFTRADVILLLGNPESRIESDSAFVYSWGRSHGGVIFIGPFRGAPAGVTAAESCHSLAIQFAPDGVVARVKIFHGKTTVEGAVFVLPGVEVKSGPMGRAYSCTSAELWSEIKAWLDEPVTHSR